MVMVLIIGAATAYFYATLPAPEAQRLLFLATGAFDRAAGTVALVAGLVLLAAALWVGRINRAGSPARQGA